MAAEASHGAVDPEGRLFGTKNVYIADGSVHPTNGGFNPVLTIMAMAYRTCIFLTRG